MGYVTGIVGLLRTLSSFSNSVFLNGSSTAAREWFSTLQIADDWAHLCGWIRHLHPAHCLDWENFAEAQAYSRAVYREDSGGQEGSLDGCLYRGVFRIRHGSEEKLPADNAWRCLAADISLRRVSW